MPGTLRILLVVPHFYPAVSGYAHACLGLVQALAATHGYVVDVLTFVPLGENPEIALDDVHVHRLQRRSFFGSFTLGSEWVLSRAIREMDRQERYDFVLFETAEFPLAELYALAACGDRVGIRVHGCAETEWILFRRHHHYRWKRLPTRWFMRRVKNVFSTTSYYLDFVKHWYLKDNPIVIAEKYFYVVANTVPEMENSSKLTDALETHVAGRISFLTLGRLDYHGELQKNLTRVLSALSLLAAKPYFPRLRLIVVGEGERRGFLERLARELGLDETIVFIESLPNENVRALQRRCDGVLLASTFEGMSMFALEALAAGAPLLVAGNTGLTDLVEHGRNGVVFDPLQAGDMAQQLDFFIEQMLPQIEAVRSAARAKYEREFSHSVVAQKLSQALALTSAVHRAQSRGN